MPTFKQRVELAANGVANPLQGWQYQTLPWNARVRIAALADTGDNITAFVGSGSDVLMGPSSRIDEKPLAEPINQLDFSLEDVALAGEILTLELREAAGVASTARVVVEVTPV